MYLKNLRLQTDCFELEFEFKSACLIKVCLSLNIEWLKLRLGNFEVQFNI